MADNGGDTDEKVREQMHLIRQPSAQQEKQLPPLDQRVQELEESDEEADDMLNQLLEKIRQDELEHERFLQEMAQMFQNIEEIHEQIRQEHQKLVEVDTQLMYWLKENVRKRQTMAILLASAFDISNNSSTKASESDSKQQLVEVHNKQCTGQKLAFCMLTICYLPTSCVSAINLWRPHLARVIDVLGPGNIHEGMGLRLWHPIEWAFRTSRLIFVFDPKIEEHVAHLLNPSVKQTMLLDNSCDVGLIADSYKTHISQALQAAGGPVTFGNLQGRCLKSDGVRCPELLMHALAYHARCSLQIAQQMGWKHDPVPAVQAAQQGQQ